MYLCLNIGVGVDARGFIAQSISRYPVVDLFERSISRCSLRLRAGIPSMGKPASMEMTSDSVELRNTEVGFLHIQLLGASVRLAKIHKMFPRLI